MRKTKTSGRKKLRSSSKSCQCSSSQEETITQPPAPLFGHEKAHLAWLSGSKTTNKPCDGCPPWWVGDVSGKKHKQEKLSDLPKNERLTCSFLMVVSSMCTISLFSQKVLQSFVCFNTFQGFVFPGWRRYEFLKVLESLSHVSRHPRIASIHYMSSSRHLIFLGGRVH